jgi:hypothetical protein
VTRGAWLVRDPLRARTLAAAAVLVAIVTVHDGWTAEGRSTPLLLRLLGPF